ncbi:MAG TPA: class I SAM-dependent methyltransferase [Pyrinomonadaceae bacterium]|nr:class I SAM-dependent methyltransferase [Pyrinomonadaceae bacterium]
METATVTRQTPEKIFKLVEPLDWSQLRALLWESHNVPASPGDDWQKLADFIAERCPKSPQHSADNYKTVFDNLAARYPEAHEIFSNRGAGQRLWTKVLYYECYRAFAFKPVFMNLGFVELGPEFEPFALAAPEEPFRPFIQMYRHVLKQADLKGKDVLEIGCGAGGGAAFIARNYQPKSVTGIDLLPVNIEEAEARGSVPGLTFAVGDATSLEFPDNSFDVVVNIESSHCYSSIEKFFSEVKRVLKPGGVFLFADHRPVQDEWGSDRTIAALENQICETGMAVLNYEDITPNINAASDMLNMGKEFMLTMSGIRGFEQTHFRELLHCRGSRNYEKLKSGEWQYHCYALQKTAEV